MRLRASLLITTALSAFCLWRVQVTVWRPPAARAYLLPAHTFLGRIEHSWLNDALYAFGMAAILYVLYTLKEYLGAASSAPLTAERWRDHQDRSKRMIGTGVTLILAWAWLEEIADLVPGYIFDKWDLAAIYLGFLLGCTMLQRLSYPVFDAYPPYCPCPQPTPNRLADVTRLLCLAYVFAYTALTDPSTHSDRWSHIAELSALILGVIYILKNATPHPPTALASPQPLPRSLTPPPTALAYPPRSRGRKPAD